MATAIAKPAKRAQLLWRLLLLWWKLLCSLNRHDFLQAPALNAKGEFDVGKPGRYFRCRRPNCQQIRGKPRLVVVGQWIEIDDIMVLAKASCKDCQGRGYQRKLVLPNGAKVKQPCHCLRLQPMYIEHWKKREKPDNEVA